MGSMQSFKFLNFLYLQKNCSTSGISNSYSWYGKLLSREFLKIHHYFQLLGVAELFHAATAVGGYHYRYLEPYTIVGIIFLTLSIPAAIWIRKIEKNVNLAQGKIKKEQL
jgi:hypothetical protein